MTWGYYDPPLLEDRPPAPPPGPFHYHFFVSYTTREDEVRAALPFIDLVVQQLHRAGFRSAPVFFDRFSIGTRPREDGHLRALLQEAVKETICMLAFVSPSYATSQWCATEWSAMEREHRLCVLPVVWKELQEHDWEVAREVLGLRRLPEHLRVAYPTWIHYFIPPRIELHAAEYPEFFPMETENDRMALERVVHEAYSFISDRTRARTRRRWW